MTNIYILTFNKSKRRFYFKSVIAIAEVFNEDILSVRYSTLNTHSFKKDGIFSNSRITIERVVAHSRKDAEKMKDELNDILDSL